MPNTYRSAPLSSDFASLRCYIAAIPVATMRQRAYLILARIEQAAPPADELDYPRREWADA